MENHFTIETITVQDFDQHLPQLANLLHINVLDGASVSFITPFSLQDATYFWQNKVKPGLAQQSRILMVAKLGNELAGCLMLDFDLPPNQPHRAEIVKLLVHPKFRRRGIARSLMQEIEPHARAQQRSLLVLDTASQGAENLYSQLGYVRVGCIPNFALDSNAVKLETTTIMYKILN